MDISNSLLHYTFFLCAEIPSNGLKAAHRPGVLEAGGPGVPSKVNPWNPNVCMDNLRIGRSIRVN